MEPDAINKKYWTNIEPENILAGVHFPSNEFLDLVPVGSSILDLGCGTGKISEYLADKGYKVTGVDINQQAIVENKKRRPEIEYIVADLTKLLPFADASFDAITVGYVFVSIIGKENQEAIAADIIRILKPGGILWLCEATYSKDYTERYEKAKAMTGLENVALSFSKDSEDQAVVQRVIRHYGADELDTLFKSLEIVSRQNVSVVSPSSGMTVETIVSVYKK